MLIAPPARITSPARIRSAPPPLAISTPIARVPSKRTFVTNVRVRTSRFLRLPMTGCR